MADDQMTEEEERLELYGKCIVCCASVGLFTNDGFSQRLRRCDNCWNVNSGGFEQHKPIPPEEWWRNDV